MTPEEKDLCAQWWANRLEIEDKRDDFKQVLMPKLKNGMILSVDYDPNEPLLSALLECNIKCQGVFFSAKGVFPSKVSMKIRRHNNTIVVKEGYGAPYKILFEAKT